MSPDEKEMSQWRVAWSALGTPPDPTLAARVQRDTRGLEWGVVRLAVGFLAGVTISGFTVVASHGNPFVLAQALGLSVWMAIWCTRWWSLREGLFSDRKIQDHVELTRRRLEARVRWTRFSLWSLLVFAAFVLAVTGASQLGASTARVGSGYSPLVVVAAVALGVIVSRRREKQARAELAALDQAFAP
jgi:hypothetical protein